MLSQPEAAFHRRILAYDPMTATQKNTWDTWFNATLKLERLAEEQRASYLQGLSTDCTNFFQDALNAHPHLVSLAIMLVVKQNQGAAAST